MKQSFSTRSGRKTTRLSPRFLVENCLEEPDTRFSPHPKKREKKMINKINFDLLDKITTGTNGLKIKGYKKLTADDIINDKIDKICKLINIDRHNNYIKKNKRASKKKLGKVQIKAYLNVENNKYNFFYWLTEQSTPRWDKDEISLFTKMINPFKTGSKGKWKGWGFFSVGFKHKTGLQCSEYCRKNFPKLSFKNVLKYKRKNDGL